MQKLARATGSPKAGRHGAGSTADAAYKRGLAAAADSRWHDAEAAFEQAIGARPDDAVYWLNLAHARVKLGAADAAADAALRGVKLAPTHAVGVSIAIRCLNGAHRYAEAAALAAELDPDKIQDQNLFFAQGEALRLLGRMQEAVGAYMNALRLQPNFMPAHVQLGNVFERLKMHEEARECYLTAILTGGSVAELRSAMTFQAQQACRWDLMQADFDELQAQLARKPERQPVPFHYLTMPSTRLQQLAASRSHARLMFGNVTPLAPPPRREPGRRIRLGYYSSEFQEHATGYLLVELLERHDRQRFEVFAYSYGPPDESAMRQRCRAAVDHFIDVQGLSERGTAERMRADGIDILFDLKGYTLEARNAVFALRPAPVQVNYLGFPGTLGASCYDYIIGDPIVTPVAHADGYDEKIAQMPVCYQPNDRQRPIGRARTRAECGLPETGFIFCSFNASFKIRPEFFALWCRLVAAVDGSVLWLFQTNPQARRNLSLEAERHGVSRDRLVWATQMPLEDHLARLQLADLVLDNLPCNAHTTASDALWAGVPVLTTPGETFASRVAASLVHAAGLPELVARDLEAYESTALALARDPRRLGALRQRLLAARDGCPLFDSARYTRDIEDLYLRMIAQLDAGQPPAHLPASDLPASDLPASDLPAAANPTAVPTGGTPEAAPAAVH
ncbi:MAG TPA: hypothetical protein VMU33_11835 [Burkholderiaceae bacterium]|nr:hypothetical protein [Burkholderiaceae bacterium]